MRRMVSRIATSTLTCSLALALASAPRADASAVSSTSAPTAYSYTTTGSISGMTSNQPIEFYGLYGSGTLSTSTVTPIGEFITGPLPATATLTYANTPFTIDLNVVTAPGSAIPNYDYQITGVLNGSITGDGKSSMIATIMSITGNDYGTGATPPFPATELQIITPGLIAAPDAGQSGFSTLSAQLNPSLNPPTPAPEPASILLFGSVAAGWLVHRQRSRRKAELRD